MEIYRKLTEILSKEEQSKGILLLFLILIMALLDVVSIASIMPFVATISNPDIIKNYEELMFLYEISGADMMKHLSYC